MPTFIGLDLAWTTKNNSGICWLEGDSRDNLRCTRLDVASCETAPLANELADVQGPVVVTIDAPLRHTPERWVETEINRQFGRYKASAHSAHAAYDRGYTAGIDLGKMLEHRGFTTDPTDLLDGKQPERSAVEVYPHTIHVRLFDLEERLPYKPRGSKRPVEFRKDVFLRYQQLLTALIEREAAGILDSVEVSRLLDPETVARCESHVALRQIDDALDGLTCAVSAWMMWKHPDGWETLGDENGYIVVPRGSRVRELTSRPAPDVSVKHDEDGVEIEVSGVGNGSGRVVRVRLEGEDLARVITVVERLEERPGH